MSKETQLSDSTVERRQLTVMCCDMIGSTSLAYRLDPEDLRIVLHSYRETIADVITRFEGSVIRYVGDGVLAYFCYPVAHEDDAERAVNAALEILSRIEALRVPLEGLEPVRLQVRIGVATGIVVTGDMAGGGASEETLALGETPNLAARLQELAAPNTVTISVNTRALIEGLFELTSLGSKTLKGIPDPVPVWQVDAPADVTTRFAARHTVQQTKLVGRDKEVSELFGLWETAKEGSGRVALLTGEAGVGKSRIAQSLLEHVTDESKLTTQYQCSSIFSNSEMHPFTDRLAKDAKLRAADSESEKFEKLQRLVGKEHEDTADAAILAPLLSIPVPSELEQPRLSPQQRKARSVAFFCDQIEALSRHEVVFVVFEDVHWCDPTSMEVLAVLVQKIVSLPIMLLITSRSTISADWVDQAHVTALRVERLNDDEAAALVKSMDRPRRLTEPAIEGVVRKAGGVPLYIEELARAVLGTADAVQDSSATLPFEIPGSLQGSLMARLDGLGTAKRTAQLAAVIGQEFSSELLSAISEQTADILMADLEELVASQIVLKPSDGSPTSYRFRHALIQDAAYQSQLKSRRRELHGQIARALDEQFLDISQAQPEVLAHHYASAAEHGLAVKFFDRAGRRALDRAAYSEAIAHLSKVLDSLYLLPESQDRTSRELKLHIMLGLAHCGPDGFSGQDAEECFVRARELADRIGPAAARTRIDADRGVFSGLYTRGELVEARRLGEKTFEFSKQHDPRSVVVGHWMLGAMMFWQGEFESARYQLERAISTYDPEVIEPYSFSAQIDVGVHALNHLAWTLWMLGFPDQARRAGDEAVSRARELNQPFSLGMALFWQAATYLCCGSFDTVERIIAELSSVSTDHALTFLGASARFLESHLLTVRGFHVEGLASLESAVAGYRRQGSGLGQTFALATAAHALAGIGQHEKATGMLEQGFQVVKGSGEHMWEAELYRLRGELYLSEEPSQTDNAEEFFRRAIDVSRGQGARAFELRSAISLARLLREQERFEEAHQLLHPLCSSFTEGGDTRDIGEANGLLDQLDQDSKKKKGVEHV